MKNILFHFMGFNMYATYLTKYKIVETKPTVSYDLLNYMYKKGLIYKHCIEGRNK